MKNLFLSLLAFGCSSAFGAVLLDPFDYPPGNLIGSSNGQGIAWLQAGPASGLTNQPVVEAGSLSAADLPLSTGNHVRFGGNGTSARFSFGNALFGTNATGGTVYFSMLVQVKDVTGLSASGVF